MPVTWLSLILVWKGGVLPNWEMYQVSWNITSFLGNDNKKFMFLVTDVTSRMINFINIFLSDKWISPVFFHCDLIKCYNSKLNHRKENYVQTCSWKICQNMYQYMPFLTLFCIHTKVGGHFEIQDGRQSWKKKVCFRNFRSWSKT